MPEESRREEIERRILEAAAKVFGKNGYARSTTRLISQEAGVTEVTLFRHFESKEKLFTAIVEAYGGKAVAPRWEAMLTGDFRADLLKIGTACHSILMERQSIMRTMLCEAAHFPELAEVLSRNSVYLRDMLARYLRSQAEKGVVRDLDAEMAAYTFLCMFFTYSLTLETRVAAVPKGRSSHRVIEGFVDVFINGIVKKGRT